MRADLVDLGASSVQSPFERGMSGVLTSALVGRGAQRAVGLAELPALAAVDPRGLSPAQRVELVASFERVKAVLEGLQQRALAAVVDSTEAVGLDGDLARHEVGAALGLSPVTAARRTRVAADLARRLPATLARLVAGEISYLQAAHLAEAVAGVHDAVAGAVESRVLPGLPGKTLAETKRALARAVLAVDPAGAQDRHADAAAERRIERCPLPEAMEGWWVTLPAAHAQAAWERLTAAATTTQRALRDGAGFDPGLDALRVDALLDAIADRPVPAEGPAAGRPAAEGPLARCRCGGAQTAAVVVDLATLLGLAEHPGQLSGYGPVPASVARELAADRDWVRWVVDPQTRRLLDLGARRYRPTGRLRAFVAAAHGRCGFPGCSQPAHRCDCDHRITFSRGGRTVVVNLGPLCRQHHNAKTSGGWRLDHDDTVGTLTWTSPLGKTYTKSIDPILE